MPPPGGGDPTFPPAQDTWGISHPYLTGPHAFGSCLQNRASLKEETSVLSSGVEVEEPTRTFGSSAPPSPAWCFSRTFLAADARIYPVAAMGSTSLDTLPRPLPLGVCRGEGEGSLCHTCAGLMIGSRVRAGAPEDTLRGLPPPAFVW